MMMMSQAAYNQTLGASATTLSNLTSGAADSAAARPSGGLDPTENVNFKLNLNRKPIFDLIIDALAHNRTYINLNPNYHLKRKPNLFPDFYDSYDYEGGKSPRLPPSVEYDGGVVVDNTNSSSIFGDYDGSQQSASASPGQAAASIFGQLSTPLLYILCMLFLYAIIIFVVFISALYSHRKRVGYNFDESFDESASTPEESNVVYKSFLDDETDEGPVEKQLSAKRGPRSMRNKRKKAGAKRARQLSSKTSSDLSSRDDEESKQLVQDGVFSEQEADEAEQQSSAQNNTQIYMENECVKRGKCVKLISANREPKSNEDELGVSVEGERRQEALTRVKKDEHSFHKEPTRVLDRLLRLLPSSRTKPTLTKDHAKSTDRSGFSLLSSSELSKVHSLHETAQDQKSWLNECKF